MIGYSRDFTLMKKDIDRYIAAYLENAPLFMSLIRPIEAEFFRRNLRYVKKPVLDFGCGDGFFCETVFGKGFVDRGLDLSNNRRATLAKKKNTYGKVVLYDGGHIPLPSNSFSTVISNCVLEHIPDISRSLKEIHRVLKPGGHFVTSVMTSRWSEFMWGRKIFKEFYVSSMNRAQAHASLLSEEGWNKAFREAGFRTVSKKGYVNRKNAQTLDLMHYASLPFLLSYLLTGKWVPCPGWHRLLHTEGFVKKTIAPSLNGAPGTKASGRNFAALFYVLQKRK